MPKPRVRDIVCPGCGYSVMKHAKEDPHTDAPTAREEALDFFEVAGCDEGNVMCPECACEFNAKTGLSPGSIWPTQRSMEWVFCGTIPLRKLKEAL